MVRSGPVPRRGAHALALVVLGCVLAPPLAAHAPHDVVSEVAFSPDFARDGTVFAAIRHTDTSYFARSVDGGRTWNSFASHLGQAVITAIAFSPAFATDGVAYLATREEGVWRTSDRGDSFERAGTLPTGVHVKDLAIDPDYAASGTLLLATDLGAFVSTDAGASWQSAGAGIAETVLHEAAFSPNGAAYVAGTTLYRSGNLALPWSPRATLTAPVHALTVSDQSAGGAVLSIVLDDPTTGVLTSVDGGATFRPQNVGLPELDLTDVEFTPGGHLLATARSAGCFHSRGANLRWKGGLEGIEELSPMSPTHAYAIAAAPTFAADGLAMVAMYEGLHRSDDGGASWTQVETYGQRIHRQLEVSPAFATDGQLFVGNYGGGVQRAQFGAGGWVWEARSRGLGSLYSTGFAVSPDLANDGTMFYAYTSFHRSTDSGESWERLVQPAPVDIFRVLACSPDFANDDLLLGGTWGEGTWRSLDRGDTWAPVTGGDATAMMVYRFAFSPAFATDGVVLASGIFDSPFGVYRSVDGGVSFQGVGLVGADVHALSLSPDFASDGLAIAGSAGGGAFRSTDGGASWTASSLGLPTDAPVYVDDVAFSPEFTTDRTVLLTTTSHGLWRSTDAGQSWQPAGTGLPVSSTRRVAFSPDFANDGTVFVVTHDWVYVSTDGGATWKPLPGWYRVDDTHQAARYSDGWSPVGKPLGTHQGNTTHRASAAGATTTFGAVGRRIRWYADLGPAAGVVRVLVDGVAKGTVDLYRPTLLPQRAVVDQVFPVDGWHEITIQVTGQANPASTGTAVESDGFDVRFGS